MKSPPDTGGLFLQSDFYQKTEKIKEGTKWLI